MKDVNIVQYIITFFSWKLQLDVGYMSLLNTHAFDFCMLQFMHVLLTFKNASNCLTQVKLTLKLFNIIMFREIHLFSIPCMSCRLYHSKLIICMSSRICASAEVILCEL